MLLTLPDGTEHEVMQRAGEAGIALNGLSMMRHPHAGPDIPAPEGIIVGFAAPAEHAFAAAVDALCGVLRSSGLARK
jgi:GntR family transcriptional regulator/MocR family aminotransferase